MQAYRLALIALVACGGKADVALSGDPALPGIAAPDPELTKKLHTDGQAYSNRLVLEASPYLQLHAHNPVNWFSWGDEAFARARRDHKLVFLSIGYSTCHWCHVMEADSFADVDVAVALNQDFIAIKVDREERPDVDAPYMDAVIAMTGNGGWPLTLVVDADRHPVFGATFLRKDRLLAVLAELKSADPAKLATTSASVMASLSRAPRTPAGMTGADSIERGVRTMASSFDTEYGGFGRGTKFPRAPDLDLLLRYYRRTDDPIALEIVTRTLIAMATGGIRDQLGGGFHRYATDRQWRIPHFEKMLYDNALLASLYLAASQVAKSPQLADVAKDTLEYLGTMQTAEGGFASASDADSADPSGKQVEGYFFTWTRAEVEAAASPDDARAVIAWFGIDGDAKVDGRSVLSIPRAAPGVAADLAMNETELTAHRVGGQLAMMSARERRPKPAVDTKVLASWNGLAIGAFARAGFVFDDKRYLDRARDAAKLVTAGTELHRSYIDKRARGVATLTDYASVVHGLIELFLATSDVQWLAKAIELADQIEKRFLDKDGGYAMTEGDPILVRQKPIEDGAEPSANALAIMDFIRLATITGDAKWGARATKALAAFGNELARPSGVASLRAALEAYVDEPTTIVIAGDRTAAKPLIDEVRKVWLPNAALLLTHDSSLEALAPNIKGKVARGGVPTAYVCIREACKLPTTDPAVLATQLHAFVGLYPDHSPAPL